MKKTIDKLIHYQNFLIEQTKTHMAKISLDIENLSHEEKCLHHSFYNELCFTENQPNSSNLDVFHERIQTLIDQKKEESSKKKENLSQLQGRLDQLILTLKRYEKVKEKNMEYALEDERQKERRV